MPVNTPSLGAGGTVNNPLGLVDTTEVGYLSTATAGTATYPAVSFSDNSLGFYQSANSFVALSYGTLVLPSGLSMVGTLQLGSGISVGSATNAGSLLPAISSMSSLVGAFIVAGSASSFTGIAWAQAKIGDVILVSPYQSGAVSSVSSGLVPWSHVTVAGQVEFRLSNVSTLVQNQSAQTWVFVRITPF